MAAFRAQARGNRLLRFMGVAAVALAGLTCRDRSLTGPGLPQRARLNVAPHFAVVAGMPLVRLSKVHAEVFRIPSGELALDTVAFFAAGAAELALDLPVTLHVPNEQFRLRLSAFDDAVPPQLVYVSDDTVTATPPGLPVQTTDVQFDYVGGDTIVAVVAAAPRDTVLTLGDNFTFRSTTKQSDSTVVTAQVGWASRDTNVIAIDLNTGVARAKTESAGVWIVASTLNSKFDSTQVSITQPVGSVTVLPAAPNVVQGRTVQLSVNVQDTRGVALPTRPVSWLSANTSIATVSNTGLVTGVAPGSTTITASSGGVSGSTTVTVIVPPVFKVIVRPQPDTTMFVGENFPAGVRLEDDLGAVLTGRVVVWASASPSVASVDPSTGIVTGIAAGSALISATSEGKTGSTTVNVVRAGTALAAANATGAFGGTVTLSATLTSRGAPLAGRNVAFSLLGNVVGLAVTDAAGVAQLVNVSLGAIGVGSYPATGAPAGVSVAYGGDGMLLPASASATLSVTQSTATLTLGSLSHVYDGTPKQVTVTTSPAGLGTVTVTYAPSGGVPTTTPPSAAGSYAVTASLSNPSYQATDATGTMVISAGTQTITFGALPDRLANESDFAVSATASSGLTVSFAASGGACSMASAGVVHLLSAGTCTITASQVGNSDYTAAPDVPQTFTVRSAITGTLVSPKSATLTSLNDSLQLSAQSYGDSIPRVGSHSWVSRNPAIASVSASGLVVAQANGVTYVVVTEAGGTKDSAQITVQQQVSSVTVTPSSKTLYIGTTFALNVSAVDGRGNPMPSSTAFAWGSDVSSVASVDGSGLVSALATGTTTVRATAGGVTGTSIITVLSVIQRIEVTPNPSAVASLGVPVRFTAIAHDTLDAVMTGVTFTWSSSNPSVAPLDSITASTARAVSFANGVTSVRASAQGVTGTATLTVQQVLAGLEVTPVTASIAPTGTLQMIARGKDANNRYMSPGAVTWNSDAPSIASVNASTGVVSGQAVGTALISATNGAITSNAATINVSNSVTPAISFGRDTIAVGRGTGVSIPVFLTTPSASPVTVNLAAADTVAYFSTASITFPANTTSLNVTLNGRNAGTTRVFATDAGAFYAGDTAVATVQASVRLATTGIYVNVNDQYATQVLLSDPSPAGGTYVVFGYSTPGVASASPDPAFIPAGQLAADIIIRGIGAGNTYITPSASGVNGTATYFDAAAAVLAFSQPLYYPLLLGAGQFVPDLYVTVPRYLTTPVQVSLESSDSLVARVPSPLTIPSGTYYRYFTVTGLQPGEVSVIARATNWVSDTFIARVTTPYLTLSGGTTLNTTSPARALTVYPTDSIRYAHYRINSLIVRYASSDTNVIKVLDTTVTIGAGQYYNNSGRVIPVGGGSAWVYATAGGHVTDSTQFFVNAPKLNFSFYTTMLGAGQQSSDFYVTTPDYLTAPLTLTIANADTTVVFTPSSLTIGQGSYYAYFATRAHTATADGAPHRIIVSAPGYSPDTAFIIVTSPRVTSCCGTTLNNFSGPRSFTVYTTDSVGTGHYTIDPVTVTLTSSNPGVLTIDSSSVTIVAGNYYNNAARITAVGEGTAKIYVVGPAGFINDSSQVYTVVRPKLGISFYQNLIGLRQETSVGDVYVSTPDYRADTLHISITQLHPEFVRLKGADTSLTIGAGSYYSTFGYAGIGFGTDTIIMRAAGYSPDTAYVTVTTAQLYTSGLGSNATTTSPPRSVIVYATDSVSSGHYVSDTVTIHVVSSNTDVIQPDSEYIHIPKGDYFRYTSVRFVGPGTASVTFSDSAGVYRPATTNTITVIGPSLHFSSATTVLGTRQYTDDRYVYTDNNVTGSPLVVHLASTDTNVATVPDSVIIPVGSYYAYFTITGQDTVGTIQIQASALGHNPTTSTVQITRAMFAVSTSTSVYTTHPPQGITVYATDAFGNGHYVTDTVTVMLASSAPTVGSPDSSSVRIVRGQYYNNSARMVYHGITGSLQLTASDSRSEIYRYDPGAVNVVVTEPSVQFSFVNDAVGVGQYVDHYLQIPNYTTAPLTVTLTQIGTANATIPSTVTIGTGQYYEYFRVSGSSIGTDTIIASAPGHKPDTSYIVVGQGSIDIGNMSPTLNTSTAPRSVTLYTLDQRNTGRYVTAATTFTIAPNDHVRFYSDAAGTTEITSVTVPAGAYYLSFYMKGVTAGTDTITFTNANYALYTYTTTVSSP